MDGARAWALAADLDELREAQPEGVVRLLPAFDAYVVAAPRDVPAVLPAQRRAQVYRPQGWLSPAIVVDGRIAGVWRHERTGSALRVEVEPFGTPARALRDGVRAEAERLAAFLGGELELALTAS